MRFGKGKVHFFTDYQKNSILVMLSEKKPIASFKRQRYLALISFKVLPCKAFYHGAEKLRGAVLWRMRDALLTIGWSAFSIPSLHYLFAAVILAAFFCSNHRQTEPLALSVPVIK